MNSGEAELSDPQQLRLIATLAARDFRHEWITSGCFVLALAAVLVPLMVLFGLKYGIVSNLLDPVTEDPRYRQILPRGSGSYSEAWLAELAARDDVDWVVPRTRSIAATIKLLNPDADDGRIIDAELIPSGTGDPALAGVDAAPSGYTDVLLSHTAARKLDVGDGAILDGVIARTLGGQRQHETLRLRILTLAPPAAFERDGVFVSVKLLTAVEDYRDGRAVPALDWSGSGATPQARTFAGFRLYARSIADVATLRDEFADRGIDVVTRASDIELVQTLDRNLGIVYWIIAAIAISGFCLSFGASLWANVERKQAEFSVLRLVGLRSRGIVWFPLVQALLTAALGWLLATTLYLLVAAVLNALFVPLIGGTEPVCTLQAWHIAAALVLTLVVAVLSAAAGGVRAAGLEPSLGLRQV